MRRTFLVLAIIAVAGWAAPAVQADDDAIAQFIYQRLKSEQENGNLKGYRVDMRVDHGTVWFKGHVANADQETLILRTAQQAGKMGVVQVVDDIDVRADLERLRADLELLSAEAPEYPRHTARALVALEPGTP